MIGRLQAPGDDEDEEEMLRRAIAMSLEEEEKGEVAEGVLGPGESLKKAERQSTPNKDGYQRITLNVSDDAELSLEEDEMLRRAIAMSLEDQM